VGHIYNCEQEKRLMLRRSSLALVLFAVACVSTTSVTRTGTGIFAPRENSADEEEDVPRGLSLSVGSIAPDGTVTLDLRNYSTEPFVFSGTPNRPRLVIEVHSGNTQSRRTISPSGRTQTQEVPAGERIQLKTNIAGASGRLRIGVRSQEFRFVVWTDWVLR
jgi:hypothetical protein